MMSKLNFLGIIPARYASTRFPGKPLAILGGKTVIERVYTQARQALDNVIVATDDRRIASAVEAFGGRAVMTSDKHRSGTDRCMEAYDIHGGTADVVINIQGDEPFVHPVQLRELMACFDIPGTDIATLVRPFPQGGTFHQLQNPNSVKVMVRPDRTAQMFSRSVIPHMRGVPQEQWPQQQQYLMHIGLYAYRANVLRNITQLPPSSWELAESLEQLRWLENGYTIRVGMTDIQTIGIDTPEDLARAEQFLNS